MTAKRARKTDTSTQVSGDEAAVASAVSESPSDLKAAKEAVADKQKPTESEKTKVVAEDAEVKVEQGEASPSLAEKVRSRFHNSTKPPKPEGPEGSTFKPVRTLDQPHDFREDFGRFYIDKVFAGRYWKVYSTAGPVPKALTGIFNKRDIVVSHVESYLANKG